jgi:hypothetical protein
MGKQALSGDPSSELKTCLLQSGVAKNRSGLEGISEQKLVLANMKISKDYVVFCNVDYYGSSDAIPTRFYWII